MCSLRAFGYCMSDSSNKRIKALENATKEFGMEKVKFRLIQVSHQPCEKKKKNVQEDIAYMQSKWHLAMLTLANTKLADAISRDDKPSITALATSMYLLIRML